MNDVLESPEFQRALKRRLEGWCELRAANDPALRAAVLDVFDAVAQLATPGRARKVFGALWTLNREINQAVADVTGDERGGWGDQV